VLAARSLLNVRIAATALAIAGTMSQEAAAQAHQGGLPSGKLGVLVGARQNVGGLADDYRLGLSWGVAAGYQLVSETRSWSVGGAWSVLWTRFGTTDERVVTGPLSVLEMNFGLHTRFLLSEGAARFATLSSGATLYRANTPIPPEGGRTYAGPYAGVGTEVYVSEDYLLSLEARYGLVGRGPTSLLFLVGFSFGR
jgi:hypothetical protein